MQSTEFHSCMMQAGWMKAAYSSCCIAGLTCITPARGVGTHNAAFTSRPTCRPATRRQEAAGSRTHNTAPNQREGQTAKQRSRRN